MEAAVRSAESGRVEQVAPVTSPAGAP
jgi:hypothetical protein